MLTLSPIGYRLALLAALIVVTWLALVPIADMPGQSDKLAHLLTFLLLAWLADRAFPDPTGRLGIFSPLLLYGAGLELLQDNLSYRIGSWADFLANGAGLILYLGVKKFYVTTKKPTP